MSQKPVNMSQMKQVYQLWQDGISIKEIVRRTGISRKTVRKYLRRLKVLSIGEEAGKVSKMTDKQLAGIVYNNDTTPVKDKRLEVVLRHFKEAVGDLSKTGVTKKGLWMEYIDENPDGYRYSQYCSLWSRYLHDTDLVFHMDYRPGEFIQADFAGKKLSYVDRETGEVKPCEVFVSIFPFSGLIFCMAVPSQKILDFATCIISMIKYFGGVALTILLDNFRTAVKKSDRYEPCFTDICNQLSDHYNTTFSATRVYSPRDKAMVEQAVNIVYQQIYAPLRKETYHSLESLNYSIAQQLDLLNMKPYKNTRESRRDIFMREEEPLLKPLPEMPYEVMKCKRVTAHRDYAVQLPDNKHYYTVPYQYVGKELIAYFNTRVVEVYYNHERIAFHVRRSSEPQFNRIHEHMPENHKVMVERQGWTVDKFLERASWVGQYTIQTASRILHSSIYPEQNFKACNAMLLLQNVYGKDRLEAACMHAAVIARPTLKMIRNILKTGQDKQPLLFDGEDKPLPNHENIRGKGYYQ